jgi:hypothetical protein
MVIASKNQKKIRCELKRVMSCLYLKYLNKIHTQTKKGGEV